jgi:hypothetical protein
MAWNIGSTSNSRNEQRAQDRSRARSKDAVIRGVSHAKVREAAGPVVFRILPREFRAKASAEML